MDPLHDFPEEGKAELSTARRTLPQHYYERVRAESVKGYRGFAVFRVVKYLLQPALNDVEVVATSDLAFNTRMRDIAAIINDPYTAKGRRVHKRLDLGEVRFATASLMRDYPYYFTWRGGESPSDIIEIGKLLSPLPPPPPVVMAMVDDVDMASDIAMYLTPEPEPEDEIARLMALASSPFPTVSTPDLNALVATPLAPSPLPFATPLPFAQESVVVVQAKEEFDEMLDVDHTMGMMSPL
jgi:hypothetical protein